MKIKFDKLLRTIVETDGKIVKISDDRIDIGMPEKKYKQEIINEINYRLKNDLRYIDEIRELIATYENNRPTVRISEMRYFKERNKEFLEKIKKAIKNEHANAEKRMGEIKEELKNTKPTNFKKIKQLIEEYNELKTIYDRLERNGSNLEEKDISVQRIEYMMQK